MYISISFLKTVYNWLTAVFIIPELNVTKRKCNKKKTVCPVYFGTRRKLELTIFHSKQRHPKMFWANSKIPCFVNAKASLD